MMQSESLHPTYLSSTIALSGPTINCCLDVAPQAGFCERLLVGTVPRDASCASLESSQRGGFMMWAVDLTVLRHSGEFWMHPRYLYQRYSRGPISVHGINLKILDKWTNPVSIWGTIYPRFW